MYSLSDYWGTQGGFFLETKPQTKKIKWKKQVSDPEVTQHVVHNLQRIKVMH